MVAITNTEENHEENHEKHENHVTMINNYNYGDLANENHVNHENHFLMMNNDNLAILRIMMTHWVVITKN